MRKIFLLALVMLGAQQADAQQFRGSLATMGRYIEMRPIVRDTVDSASTSIDENGRFVYNGVPVFCSGQTCTFYRAADVEHTIALNQDLALTTWGFGVEGLSATFFLRARQDVAGDFTWPRYDDPFDAVLAYAEFARERYRVRAGRQRSLTGLGFYSFDGLSAYVTPADWLNLEVYGGRSLARALEEPRNEALRGVDNFIPDNQAWLIGAAAEVMSSNGVSAAVRYQREIWSDRAALISERASFDFRSSILRWVSVEASADYDVAYNRLGKAHVTLRRQFAQNRVSVELIGRRYLPFFELWTIWGVFSPVAYHEAELQAGWRVSDRLDVSAAGSLLRYQDADAAIFVAPAEDETQRLTLRARARANDALTLDGEYRLEKGFGAFLSSGSANAMWAPAERIRIGLYGTAFQQILEFRTGEAVVFGGGATFDLALNDALNLSGGGTLYSQSFDNRPSAVDWTQKRAWLGLEWSFGRDPGMEEPQP